MTPATDPVLIVGAVRAAWSSAASGDLRPAGEGRDRARRLEAWVSEVAAGTGPASGRSPLQTVYWLRQVHGSTVVVVPAAGRSEPGRPDRAGRGRVRSVPAGEGDALVSVDGSTGLAVLTADCASIALGSPEGVTGAVHAGWRGLMAGVVARTVEAMGTLGATEVVGALGPCIHPGCYRFSPSDLDRVSARFGDRVRGRTHDGHPALDLRAAVSAALATAGVRQRAGIDACTGCAGGYFSHRARSDTGRQALLVWSDGRNGAG